MHRCAAGFHPKVLASAIPAGSGSPGVIVKVRTCASTRRRYSLTSLALGLHHRRVLHDPEVGYVRLHRQRLCGSVNPAFGLQGYVSDVSSVTALLDRYILANFGVAIVRKIIVFCYEPYQWYQSRSMRSIAGTVRTHVECGHRFCNCYPVTCTC